MDIEKIKKVNKLSKEFKRHGLTREDALSQAGDIVNEQEVKEFLDQTKKQAESIKNSSSSEQYMIMLERNNRQIMEEVQKVKQDIAKIMQEFEEIKKKIKEQPPAQERSKEKQAQLKTKPKENNPRQGKFKPEDVAIEKMFYFGNK
jgi:uncharacterized protein YnzC (UPF0291/DUF896 family)